MTTVWIYVDTNKEVGDRDHLKVFSNPDAAEEWFKENVPKALLLDMRSSIDIKALGRVFWTLGISAQGPAFACALQRLRCFRLSRRTGDESVGW